MSTVIYALQIYRSSFINPASVVDQDFLNDILYKKGHVLYML